jgi:hypothetical protein
MLSALFGPRPTADSPALLTLHSANASAAANDSLRFSCRSVPRRKQARLPTKTLGRVPNPALRGSPGQNPRQAKCTALASNSKREQSEPIFQGVGGVGSDIHFGVPTLAR